MRSVCFTGHRIIGNYYELAYKLREEICSLIENGVTDFYAGGAIGWDMLCEEIVLELKEKYTNIKLHLILPCREEDQTAKWGEGFVKKFREIEKKADSVYRVCDVYEDGCMKERNQLLIDKSDLCICYCDLRKIRSGTKQTVRMAEEKGIEIINLLLQQ